MKDLWNEICFYLSDCKSRNVMEKEYENCIAQCLAILGWKKYLGEITTQYPVQVGHETKLADIVVSSDGTEQFVIEVKRPGHVICQEDERQMFSYMRLLKHQVWFGLYIGDDIRLYYDDRSSQSFPEPLFVIDITKDNPDGVRFVELFAKESFNIEKLQEFCLSKKAELDKEEKIKEEVSRLIADIDGDTFKQLYRERCLQNGLGEDFADTVLEQFTLTINPKELQTSHISPIIPSQGHINNDWDKGKRKTYQPQKTKLYSLNNSTPLGCGRLALEIVKQYVRRNPHLTYHEIRQKLPDCAKIATWKELDSESRIRQDIRYMSRWFTQSDELMTSADKHVFALTNQWGANGTNPNILHLIEFARKQGYKVEEV